MEHVELETLDREHTASNKKDPQLNHEKKPTKKSIKVLKLIGTKTLLFAFIILFIVGFSALFGSTATYTGVCIVTGLLMFLKLDIGIKHTQAPFVIFGLFICICSSHKPVAWTVDKLYYRMCHYGIVRSKSRVPFFYAIFTLLYFHAKHSRIRH